MTALEIIEDTVKYYSEDTNRRARNMLNCSCEYLTAQGKMCAVGRCLLPSKNKGLKNNFAFLANSKGKLIKNKDNYFKKQYRGFPESFWNDLQMLHDKGINWVKNELTKEGEKYVEMLKKEYANVKN